MTQKAFVAFNFNFLPKMTECASESGSVSKMMQDRHVCAAHHEQKLSYGLSIRVVSIDLNDLECHSPVAGLLKYNLANICATFCTVSTATAASFGPSATAELLLIIILTFFHMYKM